MSQIDDATAKKYRGVLDEHGTDTVDNLMALCGEMAAEATAPSYARVPWDRLADRSQFMRPGTLNILAAPQGVGKSFLCNEIIMKLTDDEVPHMYMPLEDTKLDWIRRVAARVCSTYKMIDKTPEEGEWRRDMIEKNLHLIAPYCESIQENPCKAIRNENNELVPQRFTSDDLINWVKANATHNKVLIIDPASRIRFIGGKKHEVEEEVIDSLLAIAESTGCAMVIVTHTVKRSGKWANEPLTEEDIQGSSYWAKLAHCVIMAQAHEEKESVVYATKDNGYAVGNGYERLVTHNRTIYISKTRNGSGAKQRIAFTQLASRPKFIELGMLKPTKSK